MTPRAAFLIAAISTTGCHRAHTTSTAPPAPEASTARVVVSAPPSAVPFVTLPIPPFTELTWSYPSSPLGPSEVVVLTPSLATREHPLPVLIAFHGRGESLKGPKLGARGWIDDYAMGTTVERLGKPPLTAEDFLGFVSDERLAHFNANLAARPYNGLIVVCPFLSDALHGDRAFSDGPRLAAFIVDEVLPRVYRETPSIGTATATAVDGVSLGGRASLLVGLSRPEAFGSVGALQPAIDGDETSRFAELAKAAHAKNPAFKLRLLTSDGDYFLEPTLALAHDLDARGVPHAIDVVTGPHSYEFNRGPGGYEMLLFHDRALRGLKGL